MTSPGEFPFPARGIGGPLPREDWEELQRRLVGIEMNLDQMSLHVPPRPVVGVAPPGWHIIGDTGEPVFNAFWQNDASSSPPSAGFFKDQEGFVHLRGVVEESADGGANLIFTLPTGYWPSGGAVNHRFPTYALDSAGNATSEIINIVGSSGAVSITQAAPGPGVFWSSVIINNISFYAG